MNTFKKNGILYDFKKFNLFALISQFQNLKPLVQIVVFSIFLVQVNENVNEILIIRFNILNYVV